jgi:uncharacterized coiled-coil protein SlyX
MSRFDERIDELEIRHTHLQALVDELNAALIDHEKRISHLEDRAATLERRLLDLKGLVESGISEPGS